ncbi:MAG: septum formation initiator family protein [Bryobacterales bacterium]|nr:septum formation initiator family protein [Bryobacterales bacterium]
MQETVPNSRSGFTPRAPHAKTSRKRGLRGYLIILGIVCLIASIFPLTLHLGSELIALAHNQERIRALQMENNDLQKRLDERKRRLKLLKESPSAQQNEVRRSQHLARPGETVIIIQTSPGEPSETSTPAK